MIASPKKAFVLAAGFGTRMLPITRDLPKPMLPIWGVPAIERVLKMLRRWGVRDVLINLHHLPDEIRRHVAGRKPDGLRIRFSFEPEILGTGGALPHAKRWLTDEPFWMINADVVSDVKPDAILRAFKPGRTIASAWLHPTRGPRTVEMRRGYITNWRSKNAFTFCGLQLLSPKILEYLPATGMASIVTAYEKAMADGWKVAGAVVPGAYWADIGTPAQYLEAHRELRGRKTFSSVDPSARVAKGAIVRNSVVMAGAKILSTARVTNAVIGRETVVRGAVNYLAMPAKRALEPAEAALAQNLDWNIKTVTALPMGPRGSARTFTRLEDGKFSAILVRYKPERLENTLYAGHARFLIKIGVRVPEVLADRAGKCVTILEDLGDLSLQQAIPGRSPKEIFDLYRRVLDATLVFHESGAREARRQKIVLVPSFRWKLYRWEHDYFAEHFLAGRLKLPPKTISAVKDDLARVARRLLRSPRVLVHRDLQSSNILIHKGQLAFIDFQGMRYGPAAYDLASLLCDPYVELDADLQDALLAYYVCRCSAPSVVARTFWYAAIQRLGQALGAYSKLGSNPDTASFKQYIAPATKMMKRVLTRTPELKALRRCFGYSLNT